MTTSDPPATGQPVALLVTSMLAGLGTLFATTGSERVTLVAALVVAAIVLVAMITGTGSRAAEDAVDGFDDFYLAW
ncbi:hypothetical protein V5P93_000899 [Actinokineospora auranticolor]|nr:hypothetical protein [Actinokineospora auranticolor]